MLSSVSYVNCQLSVVSSQLLAFCIVIPTSYIGKDSFIRKESTDGQEKGKKEKGNEEEGYQEEGHAQEGNAQEEGHAQEGNAQEEGHAQEEGYEEESHQEEGHAQEEGYEEEESHQEEKGQSPKKVAQFGLGHYLCRALPPSLSALPSASQSP